MTTAANGARRGMIAFTTAGVFWALLVLISCDGEESPTSVPVSAPPTTVASAPLQAFPSVAASPTPSPQSVWYIGQIKGAHPFWTAKAKNLTGRVQTLSLCAMKGIGEAPNFDDKGARETLAQPGQEVSLGPVTAQACGRIEVELKAETCATPVERSTFMDARIYEVPCPTPSPSPSPCVEDDDSRTPSCPTGPDA